MDGRWQVHKMIAMMRQNFIYIMINSLHCYVVVLAPTLIQTLHRFVLKRTQPDKHCVILNVY